MRRLTHRGERRQRQHSCSAWIEPRMPARIRAGRVHCRGPGWRLAPRSQYNHTGVLRAGSCRNTPSGTLITPGGDSVMAVNRLSPAGLKNLFEGTTPFACIDVREAGEYNSSHIPGTSLIPRRQLEFQMLLAVPYKSTQVILCDDDGRRVSLAAATVERMGYRHVSVLDGGINRWVSQNYATEWGMNVPSKDFGEKVEVVHHVPEIDATELHERIERGDKLVILDTRTPEEYQRFCIPGGRSVPGGELALRITDITKALDPDTTVIVNCAGRTRSIIGTRVLQRMGLQNVYGLKNGTSGWL